MNFNAFGVLHKLFQLETEAYFYIHVLAKVFLHVD